MIDQPHMKTAYSPTRQLARERARSRRRNMRRVRIAIFAGALICAAFAASSMATGASHKSTPGADRIGVIVAPATSKAEVAKPVTNAAPPANAPAKARTASVKSAPAPAAEVPVATTSPAASTRETTPPVAIAAATPAAVTTPHQATAAASLPLTGSQAPLTALLAGALFIMFGMLVQAAGAPARAVSSRR